MELEMLCADGSVAEQSKADGFANRREAIPPHHRCNSGRFLHFSKRLAAAQTMIIIALLKFSVNRLTDYRATTYWAGLWTLPPRAYI